MGSRLEKVDIPTKTRKHRSKLVCIRRRWQIGWIVTLTNVLQAVRIRPPLGPSDPGYDLIPQRFQRPLCQAISPASLAIESPQGRRIFTFDRVFGEDVTQKGIWDYLHDSVDAFTQGYNVSVLAYGQSGSGKSYTMGTSGPAEQSDSQIMGT